jgi:diadenosine tetraphosphatase ApaH/serine/threonine PP2A family protein phosphatase
MRAAVLSDIHSNLVALDAILAHAGAVDAIWHLGDVVGYGPAPDGVVARLSEVGAIGVRGNHDAAALGGPEIDWFNPDARAAAEWTRDRIAEPTRAWLREQPERRTVEDTALVHGSPLEPLREYIASLASARANLAALVEQGSTRGLHGHTHVPVAFVDDEGGVLVIEPRDGAQLELDDRPTLINPGTVGQPRDGDPRAAYLTIDFDPRAGTTVTWYRVPYDIAAVQAAINATDLPPRLADRLAFGA